MMSRGKKGVRNGTGIICLAPAVASSSSVPSVSSVVRFIQNTSRRLDLTTEDADNTQFVQW